MNLISFFAATAFIFIVLTVLAAEGIAFFAEMSAALLLIVAIIIALILLLLIERGLFRRVG